MWTSLRPALVMSERDDAIRVENPAWPGTPDVSWCIDGVEGWLELKQINHWPKRIDDILVVSHFTPQQRMWLTRRHNAGGRTHLLIKVDVEWILLRGFVAAAILGRANRDTLIRRSLLACSPLNVPEFRRILVS